MDNQNPQNKKNPESEILESEAKITIGSDFTGSSSASAPTQAQPQNNNQGSYLQQQNAQFQTSQQNSIQQPPQTQNLGEGIVIDPKDNPSISPSGITELGNNQEIKDSNSIDIDTDEEGSGSGSGIDKTDLGIIGDQQQLEDAKKSELSSEIKKEFQEIGKKDVEEIEILQEEVGVVAEGDMNLETTAKEEEEKPVEMEPVIIDPNHNRDFLTTKKEGELDPNTESGSEIKKEEDVDTYIKKETGQKTEPMVSLDKTNELDLDKKESTYQEIEYTLNNVRTYKDAVKDALSSQSLSSAKILMEEQRRRDKYTEEAEMDSISKPQNKFLVIISVILIVMAAGSFIAVSYIKSQEKKEPDTTNVIQEIFFRADGVSPIETAQLRRNTILKIQQVINSPAPNKSIQQLLLIKDVLVDPESIIKLTRKDIYSTDDLMSLIEARVTKDLKESISDEYFLGTHALEDNEPFILFELKDFNKAYSEMLRWERIMVRDMSQIFNRQLNPLITEIDKQIEERAKIINDQLSKKDEDGNVINPNVELPPETISTTNLFKDEVISNTDARAVYNLSGERIFFYTFINEDYLFIGTNQETFDEVKKRIRSARLIL